MDRFLIAPLSTGLQLNMPPFLIMDDAFTTLNNAYVWRSRLRKRFGAQYTGNGPTSTAQIPLYSRLAIALSGPLTLTGGIGVGITDNTGAALNATTPIPWGEFRIGQYFSIGPDTYTVVTLSTSILPAPPLLPSFGAPATTYTFNTNTGVYTFAGAAHNTQIYFYPNGNGYHTTINPLAVASGVISGRPALGQMFSVGDDTFTVVNNTPNVFSPMLRSDGLPQVPNTATFNFTTGEFVIVDSANPSTPVYFYPSEPVMGLTQYNIGVINNHPAYAFDEQFIYTFSNRWLRTGNNVQFHGDDTQFFWAYNYIEESTSNKALFITNFNATVGAPAADDDPIWYLYNGAWKTFAPKILTSGAFIAQALIIVFFKGRLILLNTIERGANGTNYAYPNRCRYSQFGSAFSEDAFLEKGQVGYLGGGSVDATTDQAIVSAEFIKDRLIVYFERQTYELAYTGNQITPFVWQKLNTELGSQSTYSTVPFDNAVLTIGNTGIHSCNGSNVQRIDQKMPQNVFEFALLLGDNNRICGIRDYYTEAVYWCFRNKSAPATIKFPNQVLLYNYENGTWAYNDDTITTFGYFEQVTGLTWSQILWQWQEWTTQWDSGIEQPGFRQVIAGNQAGFVFQITDDKATNAAVVPITSIGYATSGTNFVATIYSPDHNLTTGQYIIIEDYNGITDLINEVYQVEVVLDANTFNIITDTNNAYLGNAYFRTVSIIDIVSKQWNPYVKDGRDVFVSKIDFAVTKTAHGGFVVDYFASSGDLSTLNTALGTGTLLGTGHVQTSPYATVPREQSATRLWHPIYLQNEGECIQIEISLSDIQALDIDVVDSDFELEALILHCMPTANRLE